MAQDLFTIKAGHAHIEGIRKSLDWMSVQQPALRGEPSLETIPQLPDSGNVAFHFLVRQPASNSQTHDVRHVLCTGAKSLFLACSVDHTVEQCTGAYVQ